MKDLHFLILLFPLAASAALSQAPAAADGEATDAASSRVRTSKPPGTDWVRVHRSFGMLPDDIQDVCHAPSRLVASTAHRKVDPT